VVTPAAELLLATDPARAAVKLAERTPPPSDASLAAFDALVSDPPPWWLPVDLILVAMLRESLEERVSLRAEIMAGNLAAWKELRALDAEIGRMLDPLGLTPTSRKRLDVEPRTSPLSKVRSGRPRSRVRAEWSPEWSPLHLRRQSRPAPRVEKPASDV
jgi:hypothetical protein